MDCFIVLCFCHDASSAEASSAAGPLLRFLHLWNVRTPKTLVDPTSVINERIHKMTYSNCTANKWLYLEQETGLLTPPNV